MTGLKQVTNPSNILSIISPKNILIDACYAVSNQPRNQPRNQAELLLALCLCDYSTAEVLQNVLRGAISTTSTVSTTVMHASTDSHTPLRCRLSFGLSATFNHSITGLLRYLGLAYYVFIALHKRYVLLRRYWTKLRPFSHIPL